MAFPDLKRNAIAMSHIEIAQLSKSKNAKKFIKKLA